MELLRALYREVMEALPEDAPLLKPTEVTVAARPEQLYEEETAHGQWRRDLVGHLRGDRAKQALALGDLGRQFRWMDGKVHDIVISPLLPALALPSPEWPQDGLPRNLRATGYSSYAYFDVYRFSGIGQAEMASWYKSAMSGRAWHLAKEQDNDEQIWVRTKYSSDPLIRMRFDSDHFSVEMLSWQETGVPPIPNTSVAPGCDRMNCLLFEHTSLRDAMDAFREYLGYVGWAEAEPKVFIHVLNHKQHSYGLDQLGLAFEPTNNGTKVVLSKGMVKAPAKGWPSPSPWARDPLCESTRGGEVKLAERSIRLHESLCVAVDGPQQLRIQVAYGRSYVEFDPQSGQFRKGYGVPGEAPLFEHLSRISGMPIGYFGWA